MPDGTTPGTLYVVAGFDRESALLAALHRLKAAGHPAADAFAPYPVHGLDQALGLARSRLGWITFAGGAAGAVGAFGLQAWTSAVDWPLDIGGKPPLSTLAFIPITFEATILVAGIATAAAFVWRARLRPRLDRPSLPAGITDDRFALAVDPSQGRLDRRALDELLIAEGATELSVRSIGQ